MTAGKRLDYDDVVGIARRTVDLLDPAVTVEVERNGPGDGWTVWPLVDGEQFFGVVVEPNCSPVDVLWYLLEAMAQNVSETERFRGQPFPQWLDHPHDANVEPVGDAVVIRCPTDDEVLARIEPGT